MGNLRVAVAFLTRVPVAARVTGDEAIARSLPWFPFVGAGVGLLTAGLYALASYALPAFVAAGIAVAAATYVTGAFHEDGLADAVDAFGGSFDRDEALRIMKDPIHGSYGVLALVFSVSLRVGLLAALHPLTSLLVVPAAHALSRAAALQLLRMPSAAPGLGASYASAVSRSLLVTTAAVGMGLALVLSGPLALPFGLVCVPGAIWWGRVSSRRIGGITGDVLGAAQQVTELSVLCVAVAFARYGTLSLWWA